VFWLTKGELVIIANIKLINGHCVVVYFVNKVFMI